MTTHNFHFYIGSDAKITSGQHDIPWQCKHFIGICKSHYGKHEEILLFDNGVGASVEFFLKDCKLILRPLSSITQKELREHQANYTPIYNSCIEDPWWDKEMNRFKNITPELLWFIKKGFDVGIIPEEKIYT